MNTNPTLAETKETTHKYRWAIIALVWAAFIVVFMYRFGIGPLGPFLKAELGLSSMEIGSLASAAAFGYMLSILPAGWAADRIGIRWLLAIGELIGGIFMIIMFFASSYQAALVIMAVSGFGSGCISPSTTKAVMVWFPARERATVMGLKQTGVNIGGIISAAVLPTIALSIGWRFGFLFLGILAVIIGIVSFILYKDPPTPSISAMNGTSNKSLLVNSKSLRGLLKSRDLWLVALSGFALAVVEFSIVAHLVLYLNEALAISVLSAGAILAMTQTGGIIAKPGSGLVSDRLFRGSRRKVFMLWNVITMAMCLLITLTVSNLFWGLYPVLFILGFTAIGWGGVQLTLVAELAGKDLAGTATAISGLIMNAGSMVGPMLFGYLVDSTGSYQPAWLALTVFSAIGVIVLFFVREKRQKT